MSNETRPTGMFLEYIVAYAIMFGERVAPNVIKFNDEFYHMVPDFFGCITVTVTATLPTLGTP